MQIKTGFIILLTILGCCPWLNAQLTVQLQIPQAGMIQKSQLCNISAVYINSDNPKVVFNIEVRDRVSKEIFLMVSSSTVTLSKGVHNFNEASLGPINYAYTNPLDNLSSGLLPVGQYEVCCKVFSIVGENSEMISECTSIDVEAMSPPVLTLPEDSAKLAIQFPQFTWLSPTPQMIFPKLNYDFVLSEIFLSQTPQEAIERNTPVYSATNITSNYFVYPSSFPMLDTGKYYAWQVIAKNGVFYGAKSDVYIFKVNGLSKELKTKNQSFIFLSSSKKPSGIYTISSNILNVRYLSHDQSYRGKFMITQGGKIIKEVSKTLNEGDNFISIELPSFFLKIGQIYYLEFKDKQGQNYSSPFTTIQE